LVSNFQIRFRSSKRDKYINKIGDESELTWRWVIATGSPSGTIRA